MEAQSISWWAGLGRAWIRSIEGEGKTWRREEAPPEGFKGQAWPCEWEGRFQGWLCVEEPHAPETPASDVDPQKPEAEKPEDSEPKAVPVPKRARRARRPVPKREDEVLKAIGPQTMGLLTPGRTLEDPASEERERPAPEKRTLGRRAGSTARGRSS